MVSVFERSTCEVFRRRIGLLSTQRASDYLWQHSGLWQWNCRPGRRMRLRQRTCFGLFSDIIIVIVVTAVIVIIVIIISSTNTARCCSKAIAHEKLHKCNSWLNWKQKVAYNNFGVQDPLKGNALYDSKWHRRLRYWDKIWCSRREWHRTSDSVVNSKLNAEFGHGSVHVFHIHRKWF